MKQPMYIIGSSGHAKVVIDAVERQGVYHIEGLIDDFKSPGEKVLGYSVLGGTDWLIEQAQWHNLVVFIAVGAGYHREAIVNKLANTNIDWASVVHPDAIVSRHAHIGEGCFIAAKAIVAPDAEIGPQVLINHGALVDHDAKLDAYVTVAPAATLCGNVAVGLGGLIGANATLIEHVSVGAHSVVAANATVLADVEPFKLVVGTPAVVVKHRDKNQPYYGTKHV